MVIDSRRADVGTSRRVEFKNPALRLLCVIQHCQSWGRGRRKWESQVVPISQQEYETIIADDTKSIIGDIVWGDDEDHSPAQEFRAEVQSDLGYSIFVNGSYNPSSGKLSYAIVHRGSGRIYGLDLGADHRNPDGQIVGEKHKNYWREGDRDKWAYVPEDITETWDRPTAVWEQFCAEANLRHLGIIHPPAAQMEILL